MNTIKSHGEQAEETEDDGEDTDRDPTGVLAASALPPFPPCHLPTSCPARCERAMGREGAEGTAARAGERVR